MAQTIKLFDGDAVEEGTLVAVPSSPSGFGVIQVVADAGVLSYSVQVQGTTAEGEPAVDFNTPITSADDSQLRQVKLVNHMRANLAAHTGTGNVRVYLQVG